MKNIAAIYARLSREDEDKIDGNKESRSIESQLKILNEYAEANDISIYDTYIDDGYSGLDFDRPELTKLLNDMKDRKFNVLLIKDLSRLGRKAYKVGEYIENVFPQNNIRVISVYDNYDSQNPDNDESIVIKSLLNDYYMKEFKIKSKQVRDYNANHKHLNFFPKYGYNFNENNEEIIDEYSAGIVKKIFDYLIQDNLKCKEIADKLNEHKILSRSLYAKNVLKLNSRNKDDSAIWTEKSVLQILRDYEYCGHSINLVKKSKEEQILLKNTHLAIIDEDTFAKAQSVLDSRGHKRSHVDNLSTMIFDVKSGNHLTFSGNNKRPQFSYYVCKQSNYRLLVEKVHKAIYEKAMEVIEKCKTDKEKFFNQIKKQSKFNNVLDSKLQEKLNQLNDKFQLIFEKYTKLDDEEGYKREIKSVADEIEVVEKQINKIKSEEYRQQQIRKEFDKFVGRLQVLPENQLDLIRLVLKRIDIKTVTSSSEFTFDYEIL